MVKLLVALSLLCYLLGGCATPGQNFEKQLLREKIEDKRKEIKQYEAQLPVLHERRIRSQKLPKIKQRLEEEIALLERGQLPDKLVTGRTWDGDDIEMNVPNDIEATDEQGLIYTLVKIAPENSYAAKDLPVGPPAALTQALKNPDTTQLNLSNAALGKLPATVGSLGKLSSLNLSYTHIKELPGEIGSLSQLKNLDLSYSEIETFPAELAQLKNLKVLNLTGTSTSKATREKLKAALPGCKIIF